MVNIGRMFLNPLYLLALTVIQLSIWLIFFLNLPPPKPVNLSFFVPSASPLDWDSLKKELRLKTHIFGSTFANLKPRATH